MEAEMGIASELIKNVRLPEMVSIRQNFDGTHIETDMIPEIIREQMMQDRIASQFRPGMRVAITAGSRASTTSLIKTVVVVFEWRCGLGETNILSIRLLFNGW